MHIPIGYIIRFPTRGAVRSTVARRRTSARWGVRFSGSWAMLPNGTIFRWYSDRRARFPTVFIVGQMPTCSNASYAESIRRRLYHRGWAARTSFSPMAVRSHGHPRPATARHGRQNLRQRSSRRRACGAFSQIDCTASHQPAMKPPRMRVPSGDMNAARPPSVRLAGCKTYAGSATAGKIRPASSRRFFIRVPRCCSSRRSSDSVLLSTLGDGIYL